MSLACPARTKHRTQMVLRGTVTFFSSGTPGRSDSVVSRTVSPSLRAGGQHAAGLRPPSLPGRRQQGWSAVNTTFFVRPRSGPTDGPGLRTWYRMAVSMTWAISADTGGEVKEALPTVITARTSISHGPLPSGILNPPADR